MKVSFWGVRGSIPVPGKSTIKYGGNTPCVSLETGDTILILDAGTGIRNLSTYLLKEKRKLEKTHILFSHYHYDHLLGLPFFMPLFLKDYSLNIYGPRLGNLSLKEILSFFLKREFFPVKLGEVKSSLKLCDFEDETSFNIGELAIRTILLNHPNYSVGYRIDYKGKSVVYLTDTEMVDKVVELDEGQEAAVTKIRELKDTLNTYFRKLVDFSKKVDVLIFDSQYTEEEYPAHKGWGHSTFLDALKVAAYAEVKRLYFFHHDPAHDDKFLEEVYLALKKEYFYYFEDREIFLAYETLEVEV